MVAIEAETKVIAGLRVEHILRIMKLTIALKEPFSNFMILINFILRLPVSARYLKDINMLSQYAIQ